MNRLQVLTLDSREVAKMVRKEHSKLLRDIDTYNSYLSQNPKLDFDIFNTNLNAKDFWESSSYVSGTGKRYKCYLITKKGCEFIAHKMTGRKGALFTATYINCFHEMEHALKECQTTAPEPVLKRITWHGNIVMTSIQLEQLTGINRSSIRYRVKAEGLRYFLLTDTEARSFREENKLTDKAGKKLFIHNAVS